MISYASNTGTKRNLEALRANDWRILVSPKKPKPPDGFKFGIDNGAWGRYQLGLPFDEDGFRRLIDHHGGAADFIILPDIVGGGKASLELSMKWFYERQLHNCRQLLLPVQDGMRIEEVVKIVRYRGLGIFLGGTTEWKLATMHDWGVVSATLGCHYHIGRVNSRRRIRLAAMAGATSFDGTSASLYSVNANKLRTWANQPSLLSPRYVVECRT
jgi:hypothetical protein